MYLSRNECELGIFTIHHMSWCASIFSEKTKTEYVRFACIKSDEDKDSKHLVMEIREIFLMMKFRILAIQEKTK